MSVRTCERCGETETRTLHAWGPFDYAAADRCEQHRRCERCRVTDSRVRHEWGPWLYTNLEQNSPQERVCKRCQEAERTRYTLR